MTIDDLPTVLVRLVYEMETKHSPTARLPTKATLRCFGCIVAVDVVNKNVNETLVVFNKNVPRSSVKLKLMDTV
jgi:hypothetical protein